MKLGHAVSPGKIVYDIEGEPVGTVKSTGDGHIVVESEDATMTFSIPVSAVAESRKDGVYLSVTRDDVMRRGWGQQLGEGTDWGAEGNSGYSAIERENSERDRFAAMPVEARTGAGTRDVVSPVESTEHSSGEKDAKKIGSR